jgi:hypothetical protein
LVRLEKLSAGGVVKNQLTPAVPSTERDLRDNSSHFPFKSLDHYAIKNKNDFMWQLNQNRLPFNTIKYRF